MNRDQKNSLAYDDCCNFEGPSLPYDEEYMDCYKFWRQIARFPEDVIEYWTDEDRTY